MRFIFALLLMVLPARADTAGEFDYYVMALSWSPSWCAAEGNARGAEQCERSVGFILHGLWPQYEQGWPDYCTTVERDPSRRETTQMADLMGSGGAAWHQWQKHGRCSGLSSRAYFALARVAFDRIERPAILRQVEETLRLDPAVIEAAFLEANPELETDGITVTCRDRRIQEVRICLTRDLEPRLCGQDVRRDCSTTAAFPPMR